MYIAIICYNYAIQRSTMAKGYQDGLPIRHWRNFPWANDDSWIWDLG